MKIFKSDVVTKEEFWLGIAIITFCVGISSLITPPVIYSTPKVEIVRIEEVYAETDVEGNVEVYER